MPISVPDLTEVVAAEPIPLLFATVSGSHLYGFPSEDSDVDIRGVHMLEVEDVIGLRRGQETVTRTWNPDGVELDLVTHDLHKFAGLLLRPNGYVLEQLLSPLVVLTGDEHRELIALAPGCLTSRHAHHYRGFARTQWRLYERTGELKPLLYTFRALLTGIHLMRDGAVVAHLPTLVDELAAPGYLTDLIAAKRTGEHRELSTVPGAPVWEVLSVDVARLHDTLTDAQEASALAEHPVAGAAMNSLVVRLRLDRFRRRR